MHHDRQEDRYALLSVHDLRGVVEFADELAHFGWTIVAPPVIARELGACGVQVMSVVEFIEMSLRHRYMMLRFPDGTQRLSTDQIDGLVQEVCVPMLEQSGALLAPEIQAAVLTPYTQEAASKLHRFGVPYIDVVALDVKPLPQIEAGMRGGEALRSIDVENLALLRGAARAGRFVTASVMSRLVFLQWLREGRVAPERFQRQQAAEIERIAACYSATVARWYSNDHLA